MIKICEACADSCEASFFARRAYLCGLSIAPKLQHQQVGSSPLPGQDQPTLDLNFSQDRLLFARAEIRVTEFPTKTAGKEEAKISLFFFQKCWVRASM